MGFTALTASAIGAGVGASQLGSERTGIFVGLVAGGLSAMLANFHYRSGVLEVTKDRKHRNPRDRQVVAERIAPLMISPQNFRI